MILQLLYLERLDRNPVKWGTFPMLKVWTKDEISKARSEDKVDGGDYGFLEVCKYLLMKKFLSYILASFICRIKLSF